MNEASRGHQSSLAASQTRPLAHIGTGEGERIKKAIWIRCNPLKSLDSDE
jgi:hypothetical protein